MEAVIVLAGAALLRSAAMDGGDALTRLTAWVPSLVILVVGLVLVECRHRLTRHSRP